MIDTKSPSDKISSDGIKRGISPNWLESFNVSCAEGYPTEPASNISIYTRDNYIYVTWQALLEGNPYQVEKWQRARWLENGHFDWETPQNISLSTTPPFDIPHSSYNRDPIQMKQIVFLPSGLGSPRNILCGDTDHDSLNELIFSTWLNTIPSHSVWEIWEYRPINHYELVFADTGPAYYPPGLYTGNFQPEDIGDIDGDGLTDLLGPNDENGTITMYPNITTQESPSFNSYPESLSWWYRLSDEYFIGYTYYFTNDLDRDGRNEILTFEGWDSFPNFRLVIIENIGNNQNVPVWRQFTYGSGFAFGDFDRDSLQEFVTANPGSSGQVYIYENTGPDQYERIWVDTVHIQNGTDVFSGNDVDSDGQPEFFICFARLESGTWNSYLYMWEATGNNTYQRTLVDRLAGGDWFEKRSKCGDIDGDGIDEIVWSKGNRVMVYRATGNNQFQRVWEWIVNHGGTMPTAVVNIYDMNKNGYNEIVVSGDDTTTIFEVEAVRVLSPNGGEIFHADSQQLIRWQTFNPPRCDSMSLFYSIDYGRIYQQIVHGLPSTDTSYLWTVPNVNSDSCKIKIIAYGPGWQYDESDGMFSITTTGIEESPMLNATGTTLAIFPNPAKTFFIVHIPSSIKSQALTIYDVSGKLVKEIDSPSVHNDKGAEMRVSLKEIKPGIYFIKVGNEMVKEKLVVTR